MRTIILALFILWLVLSLTLNMFGGGIRLMLLGAFLWVVVRVVARMTGGGWGGMRRANSILDDRVEARRHPRASATASVTEKVVVAPPGEVERIIRVEATEISPAPDGAPGPGGASRNA